MPSSDSTPIDLVRLNLVLFCMLCMSLFFTACGKSESVLEEALYVNPERMEEWNDWRFGLFIHWGAWSQTEVGYLWKMVNEEPREIGTMNFKAVGQHTITLRPESVGAII